MSGTAAAEPAADQGLRAALEREHHEIDDGIEDFVSGRSGAAGSATRLRTAMTALRRHIYLEEEFVFPPLRASGMFAPVLVMLAEHRELWRTMAELESGLDEGSTPTELVALARTLLAQLERHNSKEEPIVYPQADVVLDADARERLLDFLDNGAVPAGWACPGA
jgi:iron-sulfur cluster repair protein YtfE (RIC family)